MARLKKLIKKCTFEEHNRSKVTFNSGVRLVPEGNYLELIATDGAFSTADDLSATSWTWTPECVKQWIGFESVHTNYEDETGTVVTSVQFRLVAVGASSTEMYWNGADWVAAGASDWNTEEEIATNIGTFPVVSGARGLAVVINLKTTDSRYSPRVRAVKALYEGAPGYNEELLYRSLRRDIQENVRPIAEVDVESDGTGSFILETETGYQIDEIDSVYNLTTDGDELVDIFDSFDSGTSEVSLTVVPTSGDRLRVRLTYIPKVIVGVKGQDYTEVSSIPIVLIERFVQLVAREVWSGESVINKSTNSGYRLEGGKQIDFEASLRIVASKEKDSVRLGDAVSEYVNDNPLLRVRATDEEVALELTEGYTPQTMPTQNGQNSGRIRVRISNAVFYLGAAQAIKATATLQVTTGTL